LWYRLLAIGMGLGGCLSNINTISFFWSSIYHTISLTCPNCKHENYHLFQQFFQIHRVVALICVFHTFNELAEHVGHVGIVVEVDPVARNPVLHQVVNSDMGVREWRGSGWGIGMGMGRGRVSVHVRGEVERGIP